ncbi:YraN family protein [Patescibacteria group bacterium]
MSKTKSQALGAKAENLAKKLLQNKGYNVIHSNFYTKYGEIDLIAEKENTLVFVEVKARKDTRKGYPEESVNRRKVENIKKAAHLFTKKYNLPHKEFRIDVISIIYNEEGIKYRLFKAVDI